VASQEDLAILAEELTRFLVQLEIQSAELRQALKRLLGADVYSWDPDKIAWTKEQGAKGEFEKSEDYNNPEFKAMLKWLNEHGGNALRAGYLYWVYRNGATVGRKKRRSG